MIRALGIIVALFAVVYLVAAGEHWRDCRWSWFPWKRCPVHYVQVPPARVPPVKTASPVPACPEKDKQALDAALLAEAHAKLKSARGLSASERAAAQAALDKEPQGDTTTWKGTVVSRSWRIATPDSKRLGPLAVLVHRECKCRLWGSIVVPPPPAPPRPRIYIRRLPPPPPPQELKCFAYHIDGRGDLSQYAEGYPHVAMPLQVEIIFYFSDYTRQELEANPCFYAVDNVTHTRLRLSHDCSFCGPGDRQVVWPQDIAVGTESDSKFSLYSADGRIAGCPSGDCTVYVPWGVVASSVWCFATDHYYYRRHWRFNGYYFLVTSAEVREDFARRRSVYRETIRPLGVLGE